MEAFDFPNLFKELRHMIYADYMEPVTQALFSLTCREYYQTYGRCHHLLANTQRGVPNDQIIYSCTEEKYWDLMIWLIDNMSFPFEDDKGFYDVVVQSNRIDLMERFEIDMRNHSEELGKEGTEEAIDYAVSKRCDLSALLCDVALHQRKELLEKLLVKYQQRVSILNKLAIYTCALDLEKIKSLVRNQNRLTGKELDVILYALGGVNEYSEELKAVMEWFLQFRPRIDQLVDPPDDEDGEEDPDEHPFGYDGILYSLIQAGNAELVLRTLDVVANDPNFPVVIPALCAKMAQLRDLDMLKAVLAKYPDVNGELFVQHFVYLLRQDWDNNVDVSYQYLLYGKKVLDEVKENLQKQLLCLEHAMFAFKAKTFADLECANVNVLADFVSWSDVTTIKWLFTRGFSLDMIDSSFLYSLQLSLFAHEVAIFIVEEKLKAGVTPKDLYWVFYLALLRSNPELLTYLADKLDLKTFLKSQPRFLERFIRYVRAGGGLYTDDFSTVGEDGQAEVPIQIKGELFDDDYSPSRVISFVKILIENGATWTEVCTKEVETQYQGYLQEELQKFITDAQYSAPK